MPVYGSTRLGTTLKGATTKSDYLYELTDHLGNVREILKDDYAGNNVLFSYADYYPGGFEMPDRQKGSTYRFGYQGQFAEKDQETGFNQFEAREYDPRILRWTVTDPAGQFWSPYVGMGSNWINGTDADGTFFGRLFASIGAFLTGGEVVEAGNDFLVAKDGEVLRNFGKKGFRFGKDSDFQKGSGIEVLFDGKVAYDPTKVGVLSYDVAPGFSLQVLGEMSSEYGFVVGVQDHIGKELILYQNKWPFIGGTAPCPALGEISPIRKLTRISEGLMDELKAARLRIHEIKPGRGNMGEIDIWHDETCQIFSRMERGKHYEPLYVKIQDYIKNWRKNR